MQLAKLRDKAEKQTEELYETVSELRKKEKLFRDDESTGHVWVYLQK